MAGFGWRQTTVAKAEAAERPIRLNEVAALAQIFGIEIADLLDSANDAVARSRKHHQHATMMLEVSRQREDSIRSELESAQQKTRFWKERLDSFHLGAMEERELELDAQNAEWLELNVSPGSQLSSKEGGDGEHRETT